MMGLGIGAKGTASPGNGVMTQLKRLQIIEDDNIIADVAPAVEDTDALPQDVAIHERNRNEKRNGVRESQLN